MQLYLIRKSGAWVNVFSATAADQAARFAAETGGNVVVVEVPTLSADWMAPRLTGKNWKKGRTGIGTGKVMRGNYLR